MAEASNVKTSVELPEKVWRAAKMRAVEDHTDLRTVIVAALEQYLGLSGRAKK